ncbi:MAG: hypothetical protein ABI200_06065 [Gaiellales bacterium]
MRRVNIRAILAVTFIAAALISAVLAIAWLVLRAAGDVWRSPALLPQQWGTRGLHVALDNGLVDATRGSLIIAIVVASLGCALLVPAAAVIDSLGPRLRLVAITLILLPIVLPGSLVGLGIATFSARVGFEDSILAVVIAHLPFVLAWQAVALLGAWDRSLRARIDAAASNGIHPLLTFWLVTLPGVRRAALLALAIGFLVSWAQYATSLLVGGGGIDVLPVRLVPFVSSDPQVAATFAIVFAAVPAAIGLLVLLAHGRVRT